MRRPINLIICGTLTQLRDTVMRGVKSTYDKVRSKLSRGDADGTSANNNQDNQGVVQNV